MANSLDFYKGIFLHAIPVRIMVPCYNVLIYKGMIMAITVTRTMTTSESENNKIRNQKYDPPYIRTTFLITDSSPPPYFHY